jgi:pyridoxine 4-dehydrogenase
MPTVIPIPGTTQEKRLIENLTEVELTVDELNKIDEILKTSSVVGDRYPAAANRFSSG